MSTFKTDKKITDEEILKILDQPLAKDSKAKNKKKKKSATKKSAAGGEEESSDDE